MLPTGRTRSSGSLPTSVVSIRRRHYTSLVATRTLPPSTLPTGCVYQQGAELHMHQVVTLTVSMPEGISSLKKLPDVNEEHPRLNRKTLISPGKKLTSQ